MLKDNIFFKYTQELTFSFETNNAFHLQRKQILNYVLIQLFSSKRKIKTNKSSLVKFNISTHDGW